MPKAEATIKVHLAQINNNARSKTTNKNIVKEHTHTYSIKEQHNGKTELVMATVEKTHMIYYDHTGKLPMTSSQGNKYILTMHVYDANVILQEPLNSRSGRHVLEAYTKQVEHLTNRGYRPRFHWLYNEASSSLSKYNRHGDI